MKLCFFEVFLSVIVNVCVCGWCQRIADSKGYKVWVGVRPEEGVDDCRKRNEKLRKGLLLPGQ